jgi:hypothetical protein
MLRKEPETNRRDESAILVHVDVHVVPGLEHRTVARGLAGVVVASL